MNASSGRREVEETGEPTDPGWRPALKYLIFFLFPFPPFIFWGARRWGESRLVALRGAHLTFAFVMVNLLPSIAPLDWNPAAGRPMTSTSIIVFIAISTLPILAQVFLRRRVALSCVDGHKLAHSYSARWFLEIAFALSPVLYGFVATFIFHRLWPYFVGLAVTAVGLVLSAPTRRTIDRLQARLDAEGCGLSLRRALADFSPPLIRSRG